MQVVDLSLTISPSLPVFPGSPQPCVVPWTQFASHGYDSESVFMSTHTGTHMDAPSHFVPGAPSIDRIPASRLVVEAILVRADKKADGLVEPGDFAGCDIRPGDAVVICTGWEKYIRKQDYMTRNPGLSRAGARFLLSKRASLVAIDGPSIDAGKDVGFGAHKVLLGGGVLVVENLCNVARLRRERFTLVVAPLKIKGSTGSPVRAIALLS